MEGANSTVEYFGNYIVKTITGDEIDEQPLNVAAAREVYFMQLAKTRYNKIPQFYYLSNTYITMERIQGTQLKEYLELSDSIAEYRIITAKIMNAIMSMINAGVVHFDLSYENILIDVNKNPWIIDFGTARPICPGDDVNILYNKEVSYYLSVLNYYLRSHDMDHLIPLEYKGF